MARIRSVHPGQWTDDEFISCSMPTRYLVLALRNEADDNGVFPWNPVKLKIRLMPADNEDVSALLNEARDHNQLVYFEHEGKKYGAIRNFRKYQRPKKPVQTFYLPEELRHYVALDDDGSTPLRKRKWQEQNGLCSYCETPITFYSKKSDSLEIDHKIPVSRGGTNDDDNLVAACRTCNRAKGDMTDSEFAEWRAKSAASHANGEIRNPNSEVSPQRKEVGGRRKEVGGSKRPRRRGIETTIPDDFTLTPDMQEWARQKTPTLDPGREVEEFIAKAKAKDWRNVDWKAAWRNWMHKSVKYAERDGTNKPSRPDKVVV